MIKLAARVDSVTFDTNGKVNGKHIILHFHYMAEDEIQSEDQKKATTAPAEQAAFSVYMGGKDDKKRLTLQTKDLTLTAINAITAFCESINKDYGKGKIKNG